MKNIFAPSNARRTTFKLPKQRTARRPSPVQNSLPQHRLGASILPGDTVLAPTAVERLPYDGNTALRLYMREAGVVPLLKPGEEAKLAALIRKGDRKARERMILANLRLVVKIAREYEDFGLPLLDLINEGNMGLMKAVEKFDPRKGGKLSTYGSWWIRQSIRRALANQSKTIRLPVHVVDQISHLRRAETRLQEMFGRTATDEELAGELKLSPTRVGELRTAAIRPASLDAPLGFEDDSSRLADIVEDENAQSPYADLDEKGQLELLREVLPKLPPRESAILSFRFGLDGGPEKTLEEVGKKFGVTRERIRQLQNLALVKLRRMMEEQESVAEAA
ncbi:MAG: RpoD family polymerase sigma factor [Verrucomicrobiales bacterium]|nr:RpoD family polymerase sigma factor [Verrucomicrobiales bacterium]